MVYTCYFTVESGPSYAKNCKVCVRYKVLTMCRVVHNWPIGSSEKTQFYSGQLTKAEGGKTTINNHEQCSVRLSKYLFELTWCPTKPTALDFKHSSIYGVR
jgi:hypothetical protein